MGVDTGYSSAGFYFLLDTFGIPGFHGRDVFQSKAPLEKPPYMVAEYKAGAANRLERKGMK